MKGFTVFTRVNNNGQEIYRFSLPYEQSLMRDEVTIENNYTDSAIDCFLAMKTGRKARGITNVTARGKTLIVDCAPFSFQSPYVLHVGGARYTADEADCVKTEWADCFEAHEDGGVLYRLYAPEANGPRPLILFLHGGGESGQDNWRQLVSCFGPTHLAETYPDCYVLAPQAKGEAPTPEEIKVFLSRPFAQSDSHGDLGWSRNYLAAVCDLIRRMIGEGLVEHTRVYVTGLSMGGAGTIRALSVGAGLFAAAVPVCPSMTPETFSILCGLNHSKIWIATSYIDHTLYRHKYLVDGIMKLKDGGNADAHLTLYSPEELAQYDIGIIDDMRLEARFGWNHMCWVPTYHNAHGILGWMMSQTSR